MATLQTAPQLGTKAPPFRLPATDGRTYALSDVAGRNGTVVAFICNHCAYVRAVVGRNRCHRPMDAASERLRFVKR